MIADLALNPNHKIAFISDVHLTPEKPPLVQKFNQFLTEASSQIDALFILGDLFDYWLGDDAMDHPETTHYSDTLSKLAQLSQQIPIYIQHGNTDFLLDTLFATRCGVQLIADPCRLTLGEHAVLLMHGDGACELDTDYLKTRSLRHQIVAPLLELSPPQRLEKALELREYSRQVNQNKANALLHPPSETLERLLKQHQCQQIIHGHTHSPSESIYNNGSVNVLGQWNAEGAYIALYQPNELIKNTYWPLQSGLLQ